MTTFEELEARRCIRCDATMVVEPPPAMLRRLRQWFVYGDRLRGQVHLRCLECGAEATSGVHTSRGRPLPLPAVVRFLRDLRHEQRDEVTPMFHTIALTTGALAGALARRSGAPWWAPVAGASASALAVRGWLLSSALEPGHRWRSLAEIWDDTRHPHGLERSTARRIRQAPFPFVGVAGWEGHRRVGGHGLDGDFALTGVELLHDDPDGGRSVIVETSRHPGGTQVELLAEYQDHPPQGVLTIHVDGRPLSWRRYPPLNEEDHQWAAAGELEGLSVAVQAAGINPDDLTLTVGVDPEPYIAGSEDRLARPHRDEPRA